MRLLEMVAADIQNAPWEIARSGVLFAGGFVAGMFCNWCGRRRGHTTS